MKKFVLASAVAALGLAIATPASAAPDVNIDAAVAGTSQVVTDDVHQIATSMAISGNVSKASDVSSAAVNGVNLSTIDQSTTAIGQTANDIQGAGDLAFAYQRVYDDVGQASFSSALGGSVSDHSSLSSTAANLVNSAGITQRVNVNTH